jgi:hypothetical protein
MSLVIVRESDGVEMELEESTLVWSDIPNAPLSESAEAHIKSTGQCVVFQRPKVVQ